MGQVVCRTEKTGPAFIIERIQVTVRPIVEKVLLYVFDYVLYFPFALGIGSAAEMQLDATIAYIAGKLGGQDDVTEVFRYHKYPVLIIDDLPGQPADKPKGLFMGIDHHSGGKGHIAENNKLI